MDFDEKKMKVILAEQLSKYFKVDTNPSMKYSFDGEEKEVRPDLVCRFSDDIYFCVEIKDDLKKNFKLSNLLRQAVIYRFSTINGIPPVFVAIATQSSLYEHSCYKSSGEMNLANKLQIGVLRASTDYRHEKKALNVIIGSQIVWFSRQYFKEDFILFHHFIEFFDKLKLNIGTTAKTNKTENKALTEMYSQIRAPNQI